MVPLRRDSPGWAESITEDFLEEEDLHRTTVVVKSQGFVVRDLISNPSHLHL